MGILVKNTSDHSVGEVFYYISKKRKFGAVVLFHQQDFYLIALSEEIAKTANKIFLDDVLGSPLYTLAWFSEIEMLSPRRLHMIGTVPLSVDYTNRAGLLIDDNGIFLKNVGQSATWKHEFRSFALQGAMVKDVLNDGSVPKTWR